MMSKVKKQNNKINDDLGSYQQDIYSDKIDNHDEEIKQIKEGIVEINNKIGNNENFANTLSKALDTQSIAKEYLVKIFKEEIVKDREITKILKGIIDGIDREDKKRFWKKFGGLTKDIFLLIIGGIITLIVVCLSK